MVKVLSPEWQRGGPGGVAGAAPEQGKHQRRDAERPHRAAHRCRERWGLWRPLISVMTLHSEAIWGTAAPPWVKIEDFCRRLARNIFCLNDQTNIACFKFFKRCVSSNFLIFCIYLYCYYFDFRWYDWRLDVTHCYTPLIIIKQAILGWSFRQNIFPACFPVKMSNIGRAAIIVKADQ